MDGLIKYPEVRAVEDVAFGQGLAPTRLCRMLLPVWRAEVQATIYDSEPYDLIDRYLEAAIAKGGMGTVGELADLYSLDVAVSSSAARFLESIGHLSRDEGGRCVLSPLGLQSVREGKRYTRALEDRRHLYFDGLACQPLTRPYYDDRAVTFLDGGGLAEALADTTRSAFTLISRIPELGFDPQALSALAQLPATDRDRFNLPEQVVSPVLVGLARQVYLPAYVIRAVDQRGDVQYLTYTQAAQEPDPDWSKACTASADIATLVENEYQSGADEGEEAAVQRWVKRHFAGRCDVDWRDGVLFATLPAAAFTGDAAPEARRIGSFIKMDGWYFRLWCDDDQSRRRALLDLADSYLGGRAKVRADQAGQRLNRFCRQVALNPMTVPEIAKMAREARRKMLATQLDKLADSPVPD